MYTVRHNGLPLLHTNDPVAAIDAANAIGAGAEVVTEEGIAFGFRPASFRWKTLTVLSVLWSGVAFWVVWMAYLAWQLANRVG